MIKREFPYIISVFLLFAISIIQPAKAFDSASDLALKEKIQLAFSSDKTVFTKSCVKNEKCDDIIQSLANGDIEFILPETVQSEKVFEQVRSLKRVCPAFDIERAGTSFANSKIQKDAGVYFASSHFAVYDLKGASKLNFMKAYAFRSGRFVVADDLTGQLTEEIKFNGVAYTFIGLPGCKTASVIMPSLTKEEIDAYRIAITDGRIITLKIPASSDENFYRIQIPSLKNEGFSTITAKFQPE